MIYRKSGRRIFVTFFGFALVLAAMPVIAAQNSGATHSGDTCGAQLQQVRADLAKQPAADPNMRAQVNEASALCERGDEAEAQKILDQVVKNMRDKPATRTN